MEGLAVGAVAAISRNLELLLRVSVAALTFIASDLVDAPIARWTLMPIPVGAGMVIGSGNEARMLNFLIDGLLQKLVQLLHFVLDQGDFGEFDFD